MKLFYLLTFFITLPIMLLSSSIEHQAAQLANDAYLLKNMFITKYKESGYSIYPLKTRSLNYYLLSNKGQIVLVFEGTKDLLSLQTDLTIDEVTFMKFQGTKVHQGYYVEALQARQQLIPYLNNNKSIFITGHSLGGAVAHLLAAILYKEGYRVVLYTFGAPPVGNEEFSKVTEGLPYERYTHMFDFVPMLKKEYVVKIKDALQYINTKLPENATLIRLVNAVEAISYKYVHQGNHHYIYNLGTLPESYDNSTWYEQAIMRVRLYHSSRNYVEGLE